MPTCACSVSHECISRPPTGLGEVEKDNNASPACGTPDNSPEDLSADEFKSKYNSTSKVKYGDLQLHVTLKRVFIAEFSFRFSVI